MPARFPNHVMGTVVQVIGPVVDIAFPAEHLPQLDQAIDIAIPGRPAWWWKCSSNCATTGCAVWPWALPKACAAAVRP